MPRTVQGRRLRNQKVLGYAPFIPGQHGTRRRMAPPRLGVSGPTKQPRWDSVSPRRRWLREGSPWPAVGPRGQGSANAHPPAPHLSFRTWAPRVLDFPCFPAQLRGTCSERFSHLDDKRGVHRRTLDPSQPLCSSRCCDRPPSRDPSACARRMPPVSHSTAKSSCLSPLGRGEGGEGWRKFCSARAPERLLREACLHASEAPGV